MILLFSICLNGGSTHFVECSRELAASKKRRESREEGGECAHRINCTML